MSETTTTVEMPAVGSEEYNIQMATKDGVEVTSNNEKIEVEVEYEDENNEVQEEASESINEDTPSTEETPPEINTETTIDDVSNQLQASRESFGELVEKAVESGKMSNEDIQGLLEEYASKGSLSEATLDKLAEAGYPRSFVDSYIKGQEAITKQYVNEIYNLAGGKDTFDKYAAHIKETSPETFEVLADAVDAADVKTVRGILTLARNSLVSKFGSPATRTVTSKSRPQQAQTAPQGFASRNEMVTAMSDKRYRDDPAYRAEVQRKIIISNF